MKVSTLPKYKIKHSCDLTVNVKWIGKRSFTHEGKKSVLSENKTKKNHHMHTYRHTNTRENENSSHLLLYYYDHWNSTPVGGRI